MEVEVISVISRGPSGADGTPGIVSGQKMIVSERLETQHIFVSVILAHSDLKS